MSQISGNKKLVIFLVTVTLLLTINEFTVVYLKEVPSDLSSASLYRIRVINLLMVIFAFSVNYLPVSVILHNIFSYSRYVSYVFFILFIFVAFDLILRFFGFGYPIHDNEENIQRAPSPYDMFSGKPNTKDHNSQGFRGLDVSYIDADKNTYRIAFFGGSTGYHGQPPIADRIGKSLSDSGLNTQIFNFSSVSSNHNQHLHRLVKFLDNKFDLVIFYGGGNESLQNYSYDSRPGYPYNFFIRNELSPLKLFLLRYSAFFGEFDKVTGLISDKKNLSNLNSNFEEWVNDISDNYIKNHNIARVIVEKSVKPNVCSAAMYLPILQPVKTNNKLLSIYHQTKLNYIYDELYNKSIKNIDGLVDFRYLADRLIFTDFIHIDNKSKQVVSDELVPIIIHMLEKCRKY